MIAKLFRRAALHEHAEPAQRVLGAAELAPDSAELAQLLAADPAPQVRVAAARCCANLPALAAAWETESDLAVRAAIASALGDLLAQTRDSAGASALLESDRCTDAIRAQVARRTQETNRRHIAIAGIRDEDVLVELALVAEHTETRMAAAGRVRSAEGLRRLADAAKNKDNGVARLARQRIDAIEDRRLQEAEADAILIELEALPGRVGPILAAVVELNRRWQALDMSGDAARLARCDKARSALQARFDREHDEQRTRGRFERRLREWMRALGPPAAPAGIAGLRAELAALREEAQQCGDGPALAELDQVKDRIVQWERELHALAGAEALVVEAEQLAAGTSIDHASLPQRWQALDETIRTPALTLRFDTALSVIEQRRLAQIHVAQQQTSIARQRVHALLHAAEQALVAGQLQTARAAADEIKTLKGAAGALPKPTTQRLGRCLQQLVELERWESFGQHNARIQLCERAEAAVLQSLDAPRLALEVRKLRAEWKALDEHHAGVPKALWERFDGACERAFAPAARHFAQLSAQRKQARKQREEFVAATAAHAATLLLEPCDWRAIERWLRETDKTWRADDLGSVEPGAWKKLDARLKTALAPLRDALSAGRDRAKADREVLIAEVEGLAPRATEHGALSQVKALQVRWQEQAKAAPLAQRDERALWERFRAACDAVFSARQARRKEEDDRKHDRQRALEDICRQLEQLAVATDTDDQVIRRGLRELQEQWKNKFGVDPALRGIDSRFRNAKVAVEAAVSARARSREATVWQTLAAKERLCEECDSLVRTSPGLIDAALRSTTVLERWSLLPVLSPAWERKMLARRDAALRVLSDAPAAADYLARIESGVESRGEALLELELLLGLDSPAGLQANRLALQVKQLRQRFQDAATITASTPAERLLAWCAQPGVADANDRRRCEQVFLAMARHKGITS